MSKETQKIIKKIPFRIIIWLARKKSGDVSPSLTSNSLNLEKKKKTLHSSWLNQHLFQVQQQKPQHIPPLVQINRTHFIRKVHSQLLIFLMGSYVVDVKNIHLTASCCWKVWTVGHVQLFHPSLSITPFEFSPRLPWQKHWNYSLHKIKLNDSTDVLMLQFM